MLGKAEYAFTTFSERFYTVLTRTQVCIPVSTEVDQWIAAEVIRDDFVHAESTQENIVQLEDPTQATIALHARFLGYVAQRVGEDAPVDANGGCPSRKARLMVLLKAFSHFFTTYLVAIDIHSLVSAFDVDTRKSVLSSFYLAFATLQQHEVADVPRLPTPSLLEEVSNGNASVYALFGGQGINEVYFDELQTIYDIYKPFVKAFLEAAIEALKPLAEAHQSSSFYTHGLDVLAWLNGTQPVPPVSYLASVPVSFPLIGLTQFVQFLITSRVSGLSPAELSARMAGATGHSQGILTALCVSASTDDESYLENARKGLRWLFFAGLRGQQAFPVLALEPGIVDDAVEGGEGYPTPMLSVVGLQLKDLEPHVAKTNKHLPDNSKLHISLHNGSKAFVVTGPPRSLYGLVTSLRKVKAPSGLDQSKTPFSQRKPVFSVRFLVVGVPYHSDYLAGAAEKVCETDLAGEELWNVEQLRIPVFHTEDGMISFKFRFCTFTHLVLFLYRLGSPPVNDEPHTLYLRSSFHVRAALDEGDRLP